MPNTFETSFIPQQPLLKVEGTRPRLVTVNVALIVSLIAFFVSVAVGGGLYFYKSQIDQRVKDKQSALEAAEKDFDINEINSYKALEDRLAAAKGLVDEHTIFSTVFGLIEQSTAQNIGLKGMDYSIDQTGSVDVNLKGEAPSFEAAYFQLGVWKNMAPVIKQVKSQDYALDEKNGTVTFNADLFIDPQYISSSRVLAATADTSSSTVSITSSSTTP